MARNSLTILLIGLTATSALAGGKVYPLRSVYVSRGLRSEQEVEEIRGVVRTAAEHALNGMVLSAGLDRLDLQPPEYFQRLEAVKAACKQRGIEIVPIVFSAGYGGAVLAHDRNLAAGLPVRDALFVMKRGEARLVADPPVAIANGGFEEWAGGKLKGFRFHDKPGEVSFIDTRVFKEGRASLRFEGFGKFPHGHGRLCQEVAVSPRRCYRVSCWIRTEDFEPQRALRLHIYGPHGPIASHDPGMHGTMAWRKVTFGFNSAEHQMVRIYAGCWKGQGGKFWLDDLRIEEVGLVNVLRRPGAPVTVRGEDAVYEEGRDFARIEDPKLNFRFDHDGPAIKLLPGSRIQEGERLQVSYYHGMAIGRGQVSVCMSEPKLYDVWREQAKLIQRHLAPRHWLLSMDEIRMGGSCAACKASGKSMAEILGACVTRQFETIREANPQAEVAIWSDMLDPHHTSRRGTSRSAARASTTSRSSASAPSPAPTTTATPSTTPKAGSPTSTRRRKPSASCTPPGAASTPCSRPSATWCRSGEEEEKSGSRPRHRSGGGAPAGQSPQGTPRRPRGALRRLRFASRRLQPLQAPGGLILSPPAR